MDNMKGEIKDCEGCMLESIYNCTWFNKNEVCPCSICLVKVMCSSNCDSFIRYKVKIHDLKAMLRKEYHD